MPRKLPPPLGLALTYLRTMRGWTQRELAQALGIADESLISRYESGIRGLSRESLERMLVPLGHPPEAVDALLFLYDLLVSPPGADSLVALTEKERRRVDRAALAALSLIAKGLRDEMTRDQMDRKAAAIRQKADDLWLRMERFPPAERRDLVSVFPAYRSWALVERVCHESVRAAAHDAGKALDLAELALFMAGRTAGGEACRSRVQGYAWAYVGNARRVANDVQEAAEAFVRAWDLWRAGAASEAGLLAEWRLLDLEASLRREERRFPEALKLLDQAQAVSGGGEAAGRILLKKASILEQEGDYAGSLRALAEAVPWLQKDRRLLFALRFNTATNLCHLERYAEAGEPLAEARELAVQQGNELDLVRVLWLEGRLSAGTGHRKEARAAFERVRGDFTQRGLPYDAALASLDLAILWLEEGRNAEVRRLAEEMVWIFHSKRVHREALAALMVFCEAARQENATVALARRVMAEIEAVRRARR